MSDNSSNSSSNEASSYSSGRPDRIKAALQSNKNPVGTYQSSNRTRGIVTQNKANAYTDFQKTETDEQGAAADGMIHTGQRSKIGAAPRRQAVNDLSEILARQKSENSRPSDGVKPINTMSSSANDDIAHAAQLLEEIKTDSSKKPIIAALMFTFAWLVLCVAVGLSLFNSGMVDIDAASLTSLPILISIAAVLIIPCILSWGVAVFLYRARELHQISLSLAYTALHLTQPEDMASESIATIGQAVRREVAAMGDGIDRAIRRATTLESKFRTEVGNIQGFYKNNENIFNKIITDLERERDLMAVTGDDLEARLPKILDSLKDSSFDFSKIVQSADERFTTMSKTADEKLTNLSDSIEEKNKVLQLGLDDTVENVMRVASALDVGTDSLNNVTVKLADIGKNTVNRLENITDNFDKQSVELGHATAAIVHANQEISTALQNRHENLANTAEHLLVNAEQINNLLSSFGTVIDSSLLNAEDRSQTMQAMLRGAAQESAEILHTEMNNIRKSTSTETHKLIELLKQSSFAATTSLRDDIQLVISGSQDEVKSALTLLLRESQSMGDNLKSEANAITEMMHREIQQVRESALGNTAENFEQIRLSHEASISTTEQSLSLIRQKHENSIADIIVRIEQAGDKLSGTADNLGTITQRMETEMDSSRESLSGAMEQMPAEAKQALSDMQAYIDDQVGAMRELAHTVGSLSHVAAAPVSASMASPVASKAADKKMAPTGNVARTDTVSATAKTTRHESEPRPLSRPTSAQRSDKASAAARVADARRQSAERSSRRNSAEPRRENRQTQPSRPQNTMQRSNQPVAGQAAPRQSAQGQTAPRQAAPSQSAPNQAAPSQATQRRAQQPAPARNVQNAPSEQNSNKWEMPDLLSRASSNQGLPEHLQPRTEQNRNARPASGGQPNELHRVESLNALSLDLAKALDHEAPDQLWTRYRNGERNVFTRRLYTLRGQKLFDEVSYKYKHEASFKRDVDRYIGDFEELLTKIYEQDRDSMLIDTYLSSETGKVYLMLAHASGRLD